MQRITPRQFRVSNVALATFGARRRFDLQQPRSDTVPNIQEASRRRRHHATSVVRTPGWGCEKCGATMKRHTSAYMYIPHVGSSPETRMPQISPALSLSGPTHPVHIRHLNTLNHSRNPTHLVVHSKSLPPSHPFVPTTSHSNARPPERKWHGSRPFPFETSVQYASLTTIQFRIQVCPSMIPFVVSSPLYDWYMRAYVPSGQTSPSGSRVDTVWPSRK